MWQWASDAFGTPLAQTDPDGDGTATTVNLRFPGQYYDQETGLHYNWFRYYDPGKGRYVTSDPVGLIGGANTYVYSINNPLRFIDRNGLNPAIICAINPPVCGSLIVAGGKLILGGLITAGILSVSGDTPASGENVTPLPGQGAIIDGKFCPKGRCIRTAVTKQRSRIPRNRGGVIEIEFGTNFTCKYKCASGRSYSRNGYVPDPGTVDRIIDVFCPPIVDEKFLTN